MKLVTKEVSHGYTSVQNSAKPHTVTFRMTLLERLSKSQNMTGIGRVMKLGESLFLSPPLISNFSFYLFS